MSDKKESPDPVWNRWKSTRLSRITP